MVDGDIILERGKSLSGAMIAAATGGPYSHALMWVGGSDFIEAMPGAVRAISFARVPVIQPKNWLLLRAKPIHSAAASAAAIEARSAAFKHYDTEGAFRTVVGPRRQAAPGARFCSQLIAEVYERCGLSLLPGTAPEAIHPNMLRKIGSHVRTPLPLIPSENVQPGSYPPEFLDRSSAFRSSGMRREVEIAQTIFSAVEGRLRLVSIPASYDRPPPGNLHEALDLLPHLTPSEAAPIADGIVAAMEAEGYFTLLVAPIADMLPRVTQAARWTAQVETWEHSRQRHLTNAAGCAERYAAMPHPLWTRLQAMYAKNAIAFAALIDKASGKRPN